MQFVLKLVCALFLIYRVFLPKEEIFSEKQKRGRNRLLSALQDSKIVSKYIYLIVKAINYWICNQLNQFHWKSLIDILFNPAHCESKCSGISIQGVYVTTLLFVCFKCTRGHDAIWKITLHFRILDLVVLYYESDWYTCLTKISMAQGLQKDCNSISLWTAVSRY